MLPVHLKAAVDAQGVGLLWCTRSGQIWYCILFKHNRPKLKCFKGIALRATKLEK